MSNLQLNPIEMKLQTIHWEVVSGRAVGVQKYTNIIRASKTSSYSEIMTEFSIQRDDETELVMTMKDGIRVRDGQYVSALFGQVGDHSRCWLVFVNHDDRKWGWVNTPNVFFTNLGIVSPLLGLRFRVAIVLMAAIVGGFILSNYPDPSWIAGLLFSGIAIAILITFLLVIVDRIIQAQRVRSAWKILQPQVSEMVTRLR
jgi:hypothetical protein